MIAHHAVFDSRDGTLPPAIPISPRPDTRFCRWTDTLVSERLAGGLSSTKQGLRVQAPPSQACAAFPIASRQWLSPRPYALAIASFQAWMASARAAMRAQERAQPLCARRCVGLPEAPTMGAATSFGRACHSVHVSIAVATITSGSPGVWARGRAYAGRR